MPFDNHPPRHNRGSITLVLFSSLWRGVPNPRATAVLTYSYLSLRNPLRTLIGKARGPPNILSHLGILFGFTENHQVSLPLPPPCWCFNLVNGISDFFSIHACAAKGEMPRHNK